MRTSNAYYSAPVDDFLSHDADKVLGIISRNDASAETTSEQRKAWACEIDILKDQFVGFSGGRVMFEYLIPRIGKRVDVVLLFQGLVFLIEFKCGEKSYREADYTQVYDYALDLRNFHKESSRRVLVPILVATEAPVVPLEITAENGIIEPLSANQTNLKQVVSEVVGIDRLGSPFDFEAWDKSEYYPTPTIVEAAQALYRGHKVEEITRSDATAQNLSATTNEIERIVRWSKEKQRKSICFVTGVPGAGKTLIGLNLAVRHSNARAGEHAVYLSGNYPLVTVLREALARDQVQQAKEHGVNLKKTEALGKTSAFIQMIHAFRDTFVGNDRKPPEHVVIFDEAQRAWTQEMIASFMKRRKGVPTFPYSEPEFLIETMNRQEDWATIVCLVGGGQEINTGEAGLPEWFDALRRSFPDWDVYVPTEIQDDEYRQGRAWEELTAGLRTKERGDLHLATSIRSYRTPDVAPFIKALLDLDREKALQLRQKIGTRYPIVVTRDLSKAKEWARNQARGSARYGLIASSGGHRLKPEGVFVKAQPQLGNWFLNPKNDVRSSYALEDVVTEFDIQGLELDYTVVAWDADLRMTGGEWEYKFFRGSKWTDSRDASRRQYLLNTYRVLLTRARQGMVIFVPHGDNGDPTRQEDFYDGTYRYLRELGIDEI